jgi:hypothetical protein
LRRRGDGHTKIFNIDILSTRDIASLSNFLITDLHMQLVEGLSPLKYIDLTLISSSFFVSGVLIYAVKTVSTWIDDTQVG